MTKQASAWAFDNTFARQLPQCYRAAQPEPAPTPELLFLNEEYAQQIGAPTDHLTHQERAQLFSGNALPKGAEPVAQVYAGHQFGQWNPQLGDGRAVVWGEHLSPNGTRHDMGFKGSGRTPFSRNGDGLAAVGPMLREVLISESLAALGIPTTRALAVVRTGRAVQRATELPGAVLTRTAASHLRVGTFEYFAANNDADTIAQLVRYSIARHYPELEDAPHQPVALLRAVVQRQARLIASWMGIGFIHGVMNTDNMTISGETIDFGPCAFMEEYNPRQVFSSIDHRGRYAYMFQPSIAMWNVTRFAEALMPLFADDTSMVRQASDAIESFGEEYGQAYTQVLRQKLGLVSPSISDDTVKKVGNQLLGLMHRHQADFTATWAACTELVANGELTALGGGASENALSEVITDASALQKCLAEWRTALVEVDSDVAVAAMRRANPRIIARNAAVETALAAASDDGDLGPFNELLAAVRQPASTDPAFAKYAEPGQAAGYTTYCGT